MAETESGGGGNKGVVRPPGRPIHAPQAPKAPKAPATTPTETRAPADTQRIAQATPNPTVQQEVFADRAILKAHRTNEIYRDHVSDVSLYNAPDTTFWTAGAKTDPALTAVTDEVLQFFATVYGSEDMAAFLAAELLPESQREATYAALAELRQNPSALNYYQNVPDISGGLGSALDREHSDEELANIVMSGDQSQIDALGVADKRRLAGIADEFLATLEGLPDMGVSGDIRQAVAIGATGDVSMALTSEQIDILKTVQGQLEGLKFGGTTTDLDDQQARYSQVGIDQIRALGNGLVVLDMEWAKQNVSEAYAIKTWLELNHPDMEIQFGREGIWGSLLDKISIPVDYLTAPIGAAIIQADEFVEQVTTSGDDRQKKLDQAAALEQRLQAGDIPQNKVEDTLAAIHQLRDEGTIELGMEAFNRDVLEHTRPRVTGFGFADSMMKAMELHPGDTGYSAAYAVTGLLGALVLDPLNWGPAILGGAKAARLIPKGALPAGALDDMDAIAASLRLADDSLTDAQALAAARRIQKYGEFPEIGQGWIKNSVYRRLAKTPEELAATKPFARGATRLWRLREELGPEKFSSALGQFFTHNSRRLGGGTDIAKHLSDATSQADMEMAVVRAMTGSNYNPSNVDQLIARLNRVDEQLDAINRSTLPPAPGLSRDDLIMERGFLNDLIKGQDWVRPMQSLMSKKSLRQLERVSGKPLGIHGRVVKGAIDLVEDFPGNIAITRNVNREKQERKLLLSLENMYKDTGAGTVLSFPHTSPYAKALRRVGGDIVDDAAEESFQAITDIARFFGLKQDRINELMSPWTRGKLTSGSASYDWWKNTWTTMVDESPRLTAVGKSELKTMWRTLVESRSPGYIVRRTESGMSAAEPTLFKLDVDPRTGEAVAYGKPAFEADQFQSWRLPSLGDLRQHMTLTQRTLNDWSKTGGFGKKAISGAHLAASQTFTAVSSIWRSAVLGFRLLGALPARIGMEQMLRIAGYDYASMVWHPAEWFASTKLGNRIDPLTDVALFTDSPTSALGVMIDSIDSNPNAALIRAGRERVVITDGLPFFRAYSERLSRLYASPSVHYWHLPYLGDADRTLDAMRAGRHADDAGKEWLATYAEYEAGGGADVLESIRRTQQEISELIGTGPGTDLIKTALRRGQVKLDGVNVRVGTSDFAEALERMASRGEWVPTKGLALNRSAGDYLPLGRVPALTQFKDKMFRVFYSAPDLALSRSPLYRQIGAREYRNLIRVGYKPENALRLARARAARGTAEMMFTIGAKTSGEYFLRNISPFFPAYRELATTWLKRLPMRVGEGHWALGSAALVRRADIWQQFFQDLGVLRKDEQGKLYVPIPFLAPVVQLMTGTKTEYSVKAPLESFAGVLPVPIGVFERDEDGNLLPLEERLKGIMPTLGAPAAAGLGIISDLFGGALEDLENWTTLYGTDASLGPVAVDRFFEAFGITMPWMTGTTREYHESVRTWAVIDGMRIAQNQMGEPPTDPAERKAYIEEMVERGERYAMGTYLLRSITGMTLPFSVQIEDEGKEQMSALWGLINSLPEDESGVPSALIDSVLTEYPNLEPYMTGKNQDTRLAENPQETLDEYMQAVKDGEIKIRSAEDWAVFALGMNSYSVYQSRVNAIYEAATTPADWILDFNAKNAVQRERMAWQDFLDATQDVDNFLPGQTQSFADMFNTYQEYKDARDGESERLSREQERLLDFDFAMKEFAKYFSPNPETSDDYFKLRDAAFQALGGKPQGEIAQAQAWYFGEVSERYYNERDRLYKKLDGLDDDQKAPVFQELRNLANEYHKAWINKQHPEWGEFPSPEEYVFLKLDPEDQERQVAEWAVLPSTFLSQFQREMVGYDIPEELQDAANKLAAFVTTNEIEFDKAVERYDIAYSSDTYAINRRAYDKAYLDRARKLGIEDYWLEANKPEYIRIGKALGLAERSPTWGVAVERATQAIRLIESTEYASGQFYSAAGDSDIAERERAQFSNAVRAWRRSDAAFDQIMTDLSVWLAEEGQQLGEQDLIDTLFFDVYRP